MHTQPHMDVTSFFFNDTATTEIYPLSPHDALPIWPGWAAARLPRWPAATSAPRTSCIDRKSTRLNSSHLVISYSVFCLNKTDEMRRGLADVIRYTVWPGPCV